jgi:hypothetical protein
MMKLHTDQDIHAYQQAIVTSFPDLAPSSFVLEATGWDSVAIDVDDRLIFKFPRHPEAQTALLREASLLAAIRPHLSLVVPNLRIIPGTPLFSMHEKLPGKHLVSADYDLLPEVVREQLASKLGRFYAELHRLSITQMQNAGAMPIKPWQVPEAIRLQALPLLPSDLRIIAAQAITAFEALPPDPYGTTYGFFDGHDWNMAFDEVQQQLNGVYDFADSGIGSLHQEFIYSNFISPDLTERIITCYEAITMRQIDRQRVILLTGVHRLSELTELIDYREELPMLIENINKWAKYYDNTL